MYILFTITLYLPLILSENENKDTSLSDNDEDITFRVVNGRPATLGQIPYQVSLKRRISSYEYANFCGGSIVGRNKILSAGHCFFTQANVCERACGKKRRRNLKNVYAVAGTLRTKGYYKSDSEGSEQWRTIKHFVVPKGYDFPKKDIALAFTNTPFVINNYVRALPMAQINKDYGSIECLASGYGRINRYIVSDSLLWANIRLEPMLACSLLHGKDMQKFICTSSDVSDVLQGDSGGPLVCKGTDDPNDRGQGVIVGVVSGAEKTSRSRKWQTFFTRVSSYRSFYLQNGETTPVLSQFYMYVLAPITIISKFNYFILFDFTGCVFNWIRD